MQGVELTNMVELATLGTAAFSDDGMPIMNEAWMKQVVKREIEHARSVAQAKSKYNELAIENPRAAGFFICLEGLEQTVPGNPNQRLIPAEEEIYKTVVQELGMTVYLIKGGKVYESEYNPEAEGFKFIIINENKPIDPVALISRPSYTLIGPKRKSVIEEITNDSPFDDHSIGGILEKEAMYVDARDAGRLAYLELDPVGIAELVDVEDAGVIELFTRHDRIRFSVEEKTTPPPSPGLDRVKERVLCRINYSRRTGKLLRGENFTSDIRNAVHTYGYPIKIGRGQNYGSVSSREVYLEYMKTEMDNLSRKEDEYSQSTLARLAFHLYGFGESARQFGDKEISVDVNNTLEANQLYKQCEETISRRVGPKGEFRMEMADLGVEGRAPSAAAAKPARPTPSQAARIRDFSMFNEEAGDYIILQLPSALYAMTLQEREVNLLDMLKQSQTGVYEKDGVIFIKYDAIHCDTRNSCNGSVIKTITTLHHHKGRSHKFLR